MMTVHTLSALSEDRQQLLGKVPQGAVCAEIGVWRGEFSQHIDRLTRPRELVLVDPWAFQPEFPHRMFGGSVAKSQADMDAIHDEVCRKMTGDHIRIVRRTSLDAVGDFPDAYFDWVYIDGNHYYDYVRQDLEAWHPKVKPGGLLTGDDYLWRDENGTSTVAAAVSDFLQHHTCTEAVSIGNQFLIRLPG